MSSGAGPHRGEKPLPEPDWDNPVPYDGYPEPHDTDMIGVLDGRIRELQAWVTAAYVQKPTRERVTDLVASLTNTAIELTAYAETLEPDQQS